MKSVRNICTAIDVLDVIAGGEQGHYPKNSNENKNQENCANFSTRHIPVTAIFMGDTQFLLLQEAQRCWRKRGHEVLRMDCHLHVSALQSFLVARLVALQINSLRNSIASQNFVIYLVLGHGFGIMHMGIFVTTQIPFNFFLWCLAVNQSVVDRNLQREKREISALSSTSFALTR